MSSSLQRLMSLDQRVAVVTGGAVGAGAAIASRLAEGGASVVVADLDLNAAERTAAAQGERTSAAAVDIGSAQSVRALAQTVLDRHGRVDIWVNNAGVYPRDPLLTMSPERWQRVIDVNLTGTFLCSQAAGRLMTDGGRGGVIVNVASLSAYRAPSPDMSHYVASKAGVVGLTRSLAVELGPARVRVVAVAPSFIRTDNAVKLLGGNETSTALAEFSNRTPLRRVVEADDVATVVYFAVSDLAAMVTGSVLLVDGGQLAS